LARQIIFQVNDYSTRNPRSSTLGNPDQINTVNRFL
jgi:hypothetical protein